MKTHTRMRNLVGDAYTNEAFGWSSGSSRRDERKIWLEFVQRCVSIPSSCMYIIYLYACFTHTKTQKDRETERWTETGRAKTPAAMVVGQISLPIDSVFLLLLVEPPLAGYTNISSHTHKQREKQRQKRIRKQMRIE